MSLKELVKLVPPPEHPADVEGYWRLPEIILGTTFPPDFMALIGRYGSGRFFQGHLHVFNPLTLEWLACLKNVEQIYNSLNHPLQPLPLSTHPASPGLLFWGCDENGNDCAWLTKGKPEKWPVVFLGHGYAAHPKQYRMTITSFLAGYAVDKFPELYSAGDELTDERRTFTPRPLQQAATAKAKKPRRKKRKG
jgi:hypothetical protein